MSKGNKIYFKDHLPKVEKVKIDDMSTRKIGQEGEDFIKLGEANKVDFNAFFVMFSVWMKIPSKDKEAVIVKLINDGKVEISEDVRKSNKNQ